MIDRAWLTYRLNGGFVRGFPQPFTFMTMRSSFDALLAERAVSAGAELLEGFRVERVETNGGPALVHGQSEVVAADVLVGADGVNSIVAHQLGLLRDAEMGVGLESEVYVEPGRLEPWARTAGLDFGSIRGGYMWVFPKSDHLSIGVAGFRRIGPSLKGLLERYLARHGIDGSAKSMTKGHRLPRRRRGTPIQSRNALLVGDAAGLVDFWTGEGIYYAMRSAQLAAPAVVEYLEGRAPDLRPYEGTVDQEIMPDLQIARSFTRIGVALPWLAYTLMKRSDRAWRASCGLLRGDKSYHDFRRALGPLARLLDLAGKGV